MKEIKSFYVDIQKVRGEVDNESRRRNSDHLKVDLSALMIETHLSLAGFLLPKTQNLTQLKQRKSNKKLNKQTKQ